MPASLTDSPKFRAWYEYIKSASAPHLTCRRTLMSILAERFRASRSALTIGGSRIFFRGGLKDEFIRMCTDCIVVKAQLLR